MTQIKALLRSFACAGRGIVRSVKSGRNLRIHLVVGSYVTALGFVAKLEGVQWGVLLLCIGMVLSAELINTALEHLCDVVHPQHHPLVGAAKDAAAGAVLVLALASVGVGLAIFGPWVLAGGLGLAVQNAPWLVPVFILSLIPMAFFVFGQDKINRNRKK